MSRIRSTSVVATCAPASRLAAISSEVSGWDGRYLRSAKSELRGTSAGMATKSHTQM